MRCQHRHHGFILPATLGFIAVLTVVIAALTDQVQQGVGETAAEQRRWQAELALVSTQASVTYVLTTQPVNEAGFTTDPGAALVNVDAFMPLAIAVDGSELNVDDRPYQGLNDARFSLQDVDGLIGLDTNNTRALERLLGVLGVEPQRRGVLAARLQDFTDPDDLHRLNGAEARDYRDTDLAPPPNRPLFTPWEARAVLGWDEHPELWENHRFARLTSVVYGVGINLNAAPAEVLQTIPGIDQILADQLIEARPLTSLTQASWVIGRPLPLDPLTVGFTSTSVLRLTLWHPDLPYRREQLLRLTPTAEGAAPWTLEYELDINLNANSATDPAGAPNEPPGTLGERFFAAANAASS